MKLGHQCISVLKLEERLGSMSEACWRDGGPVYACGYSDQPEELGRDGCVPVPDGLGLGVTYDWGYIEKNRTHHHVFGAG